MPIRGYVSVQVFYIISGFYMALILNTKYVGPGSYRVFIANRLLRIFPAYHSTTNESPDLTPWTPSGAL